MACVYSAVVSNYFLHFIPVLISCLHLFSVMCSTLLWATQKAWLSLIVLQEVGEGMCPLLLLGACLNASSFAESMCPLASCSLITSKSPECSLCNPAIVNLSGEGGAGYVVRLRLQDAWPCAAPSRSSVFFMGAGAI